MAKPQTTDSTDPPQRLECDWEHPTRNSVFGDPLPGHPNQPTAIADWGVLRLRVWTHHTVGGPAIRWYVSAGATELRQVGVMMAPGRAYFGAEGPAGSVEEAKRYAEAVAASLEQVFELLPPALQPKSEVENICTAEADLDGDDDDDPDWDIRHLWDHYGDEGDDDDWDDWDDDDAHHPPTREKEKGD